MSLVLLTFLLTIFATFLTRSGLIESVHSFAQELKIAYIFLSFMGVVLLACILLIIYRLPKLQSENSIQSFLSRESAFLFNNLILQVTSANPCRAPAIQRAIATKHPTMIGIRKFFWRFRFVARRHAITGPIPANARSTSPIGKLTFSKKGGPTLTCSPVTPSATSGKIVPQKTAKAAPRRIRLLNRKADSRERNDCMLFSL